MRRARANLVPLAAVRQKTPGRQGRRARAHIFAVRARARRARARKYGAPGGGRGGAGRAVRPLGRAEPVRAGGCAGLKYMMGLVAEIDPADAMVESDGVKVFVDADSLPHIDGTTIDFVIGLQGSGFTFDNPQAKNSCSCGKSFG